MQDKFVYVCVEETPDDGKRPVAVYDTLEAARGWIREQYLKFKADYPDDECVANNDNYDWSEVHLGGEDWWQCYYDCESYGWYVRELPVTRKVEMA